MFLLTLTVRHDAATSLSASWGQLCRGHAQLVRQGTQSAHGRGAKTEYSLLHGGLARFDPSPRLEGGWHPHCHTIALATGPLDKLRLLDEWRAATGDPAIKFVDVTDAAEDREERKRLAAYSVPNAKHGWSPPQRLEAFVSLGSLNTAVRFGCFHGRSRRVTAPMAAFPIPADSPIRHVCGADCKTMRGRFKCEVYKQQFRAEVTRKCRQGTFDRAS